MFIIIIIFVHSPAQVAAIAETDGIPTAPVGLSSEDKVLHNGARSLAVKQY